jgi:hypothetical protein
MSVMLLLFCDDLVADAREVHVHGAGALVVRRSTTSSALRPTRLPATGSLP